MSQTLDSRDRQSKYHQRTSLTVSVEWELLHKVKQVAKDRHITVSEIINDGLIRYLTESSINQDQALFDKQLD
jgi:hypothetical protein